MTSSYSSRPEVGDDGKVVEELPGGVRDAVVA
jgi:hypothetical protein